MMKNGISFLISLVMLFVGVGCANSICCEQTNWKPGRRFDAGTSMEQIKELLSSL